jgi:hypothetical protein
MTTYAVEEPTGTEDPTTGQTHDTEVEPGTDTDTMTVPGYPSVPDFDTSIVTPEQKSIPDLITGWLANAPFMNIITGMKVEATSGSCTIDIPLPEVLGGMAELNFCQFESVWSAIGVIIIAISYIYGAMIIFGGKS